MRVARRVPSGRYAELPHVKVRSPLGVVDEQAYLHAMGAGGVHRLGLDFIGHFDLHD